MLHDTSHDTSHFAGMISRDNQNASLSRGPRIPRFWLLMYPQLERRGVSWQLRVQASL